MRSAQVNSFIFVLPKFTPDVNITVQKGFCGRTLKNAIALEKIARPTAAFNRRCLSENFPQRKSRSSADCGFCKKTHKAGISRKVNCAAGE